MPGESSTAALVANTKNHKFYWPFRAIAVYSHGSMKWTTEVQQAVLDNIADAYTGCWCVYVPVSPTHGVKFYRSPEIRDMAMVAQECAYEVDCGPAVGEACEITASGFPVPDRWENHDDSTPTQLHGYITEAVDTSSHLDGGDWQELSRRLHENGFSTRDSCSSYNTGYRQDGIAVLFDFDPLYGPTRYIFDQDPAVVAERNGRWEN